MIVRHPDAVRVRAYIAWVFVCIVWGTTYLAIRICLETVPPLLMSEPSKTRIPNRNPHWPLRTPK